MNKDDQGMKLSPCLTNVQSAHAEDDVSATRLARTVCEKHGPTGPPYKDILTVLTEPDMTETLPFDAWLRLLIDSCSETVQILHTDLTLLLLARHSPPIAAAFANSESGPSIDKRLRENLYQFIADEHAEHEVVSREEFWELITNARKTDGKPRTTGRDRAAIVYVAEDELTHIEDWASEVPERICLPIRVRLELPELEARLPELCANFLENRSSGKRSQSGGKVEQLATQLRMAASTSQNASGMLTAWLSILQNDSYTGQRVVLILELEEIADIDLLNRWLSHTVAPSHDRLSVVVGGIPFNASLEHPRGTWAYRLKSADESVNQCIVNDDARGKDLLELTQEIDALTDAISSVELIPPLVVGICGGWGSGKSFILDLIDRRLREIRKQEVAEDSLHVGHIYWIEFDAWTYSKKNLWASLMDQICKQFEEQLMIERLQVREQSDEGPNIPADLPPWVVSKTLAGTEPFGLSRCTKWAEELGRKQMSLGDLLIATEKGEKRIRLKQELEEEKATESRLMAERESKIQRDLQVRVTRNFVSSISLGLLRSLGIDRKTLEHLEGVPKVVEQLKKDRPFSKKIWLSLRGIYGIVILVISGVCAVAVLEDVAELALAAGTTVTSLVAGFSLAWSKVRRAGKNIRDHLEKFSFDPDENDEAARKAVTGVYDAEHIQPIRDSRDRQRTLRKELDESHENLAGFHELEELQGFLEIIRKDEVYAKHLGLMNQVQQHLQKLSGLVMAWTEHSPTDGEEDVSPFPRGMPRIVLKIEDLDRCPPAKVVEVLEAAQLLVKTKLFVVILALDLRYVTRAIEKRYDGILSHDEHPTGLDYIEKIIQLPYQVRPIAEEHLEPFFSGQLEVVSEVQRNETRIPENLPTPAVGEIPPRTITVRDRSMQREVIQLSETEFNDLVRACRPLGLSPRAGKRISNVYKIWKLLWHKRGEDPSREPGLGQTMVAILALSTVRPRLAQNGLRALAHSDRRNEKREKLLNSLFLA